MLSALFSFSAAIFSRTPAIYLCRSASCSAIGSVYIARITGDASPNRSSNTRAGVFMFMPVAPLLGTRIPSTYPIMRSIICSGIRPERSVSITPSPACAFKYLRLLSICCLSPFT